MDKPTSDKDVIKSLPEVKGESTGLRYRILPPERARIKPVFDKMLAALKAVVACDDRSDDERYRIVYEAIKEAEELGL